tara:strand:+ start:4035 stop:5456 length:1422 start_codon:yes stop_codon:yes gene_type:complete
MNDQYEKDDLSNIRQGKDMELPNLLRVAPFDMRTDMRVETSILDPVVNTIRNCRFVIPNKGILNSATARINLGVLASDVGADKSAVFLPLPNGIYSMVNRAVLRVGTKVLSECLDLNYYMAYRSNLLHSETIKNIENVVSGRGLSVGLNPYNLTDTSQQTNLSNAYSYVSNAGENNIQNDYNLHIPPYANMYNNDFVNFQISLKELFPILGQWNLPLFMMREQVSIELFYSPNDEHTSIDDIVVDSDLTAQVEVNTDKCFLICDYIYYDEDKMDIIRQQQNANPVMDYVEHQLVKSSIPDDASGDSFIRNVGGAGQYVNKIMSMNNPILDSDDSVSTILGPYASSSPDGGSLSYNLIYNDLRLFPVNVTNLAHIASNIQYAEVIPLNVPIAHFTKGNVSSPVQLAAGMEVKSSCDGKRFFICTKLLNNNRINQRGILLQQNATFNNTNTINRSYLEILKGMKIVNGYLEVMFL